MGRKEQNNAKCNTDHSTMQDNMKGMVNCETGQRAWQIASHGEWDRVESRVWFPKFRFEDMIQNPENMF